MKTLRLALLLLAAACVAQKPAGPTATDKPVPSLPAVMPPAPANPTPRQARVYRTQLRAWERVERTRAKALAVPRKVKTKGAGAQSVVAAPGAVVSNSHQTTDNRKAGQRGGAAATAPHAQASATTQRPGFPWWVLVLVASLLYGAYRYLKPRWL